MYEKKRISNAVDLNQLRQQNGMFNISFFQPIKIGSFFWLIGNIFFIWMGKFKKALQVGHKSLID